MHLYLSSPLRPSSTIGALALANARFWPTVYPHLHRQLASWESPATSIPDPVRRSVALDKLHSEAFNAEVASTLATLAPQPLRPTVVRAIVSLEILFDYLDGRTESLPDPLSEAPPLYEPFVDALQDPQAGRPTAEDVPRDARPMTSAAATTNSGLINTEADAAFPDAAYLRALSVATRDAFSVLPSSAAVQPVAVAATSRCSEAQTRIHAVPALGVLQLREWATSHGSATGLEWREYAAGCASSVLAAHALIVLASRPCISEDDTLRLDSAYLAIGAVITLLDSIVDHPEDSAIGAPNFASLFEVSELPDVLRSLVRLALSRTRETADAAHHAMTLAGVAAYYTTHPGASSAFARPSVRAVRDALSPTILPTLLVMRSWRTAKHLRRLAPTSPPGSPSPAKP